MAKLLFSLRGVPDDEVIDIIEILNSHQLDYYETSAGNWGISMPALWVVNNGDYEKACGLLNEYHRERAITQRKIYDQLKKEGKSPGMKDIFLERPFRFALYIGGVIFIFYVSVKLLFEFGL